MSAPATKLGHGICGNCGFNGLVALVKDFITKESLDGLTAGEPIYSKTMFICPTCIETPVGVLSPNLAHKRLPEAEYQRGN